jgi:hypothetical protein
MVNEALADRAFTSCIPKEKSRKRQQIQTIDQIYQALLLLVSNRMAG